MSLDVYVMPLWRFKSGHAQTAVGRVFPGMSAIIDAFGIFSPTRRRARRHSRDLVNKLVTEAEGVLNTKLIWQDRGSVVFAEQASWGFQALQAYAKWLDLTDVFPTFSDPPENNFYKHPTMLWSEGTPPLDSPTSPITASLPDTSSPAGLTESFKSKLMIPGEGMRFIRAWVQATRWQIT